MVFIIPPVLESKLNGRGENSTEDMSAHNELGKSAVLGQYCWLEPAASSEPQRRKVKVNCELALLQQWTAYRVSSNHEPEPKSNHHNSCEVFRAGNMGEEEKQRRICLFPLRNAE